MKNNEQQILAAANTATLDRASVSVHRGVGNHRAIKVHGCFLDAARTVCDDIAKAIEPLTVDHDGAYPAVVVSGSDALVWWR